MTREQQGQRQALIENSWRSVKKHGRILAAGTAITLALMAFVWASFSAVNYVVNALPGWAFWGILYIGVFLNVAYALGSIVFDHVGNENGEQA